MLDIILDIVCGCTALISAFTVKTWYQSAPGTSKLGPPLPLWFGRLIAVIAGSGFLFAAYQDIWHK